MDGIIFDVKRFAVHDGDGIRTTVFLKGCPLRCRWCHNPEGLGGKPQLSFTRHNCTRCGLCAGECGCHKVTPEGHEYDRGACVCCGKCAEICPSGALKLYGRRVTAEELIPKLLEDRLFYETSGGGITLSGGECLLQPEFCRELLRAMKEERVQTAVDTSGAVPRSALETVLPWTDAFLYDLKAVDPEVHRFCTGRDNAEILSNLRWLDTAGVPIEIRIPWVPGYNDGELPAMAELLAGMKHLTGVRLLPYHDYARSKYAALDMEYSMRDIGNPTPEAARDAREFLRGRGLNVKE